jgi:putative aldouronate transport system substrate-binding protein
MGTVAASVGGSILAACTTKTVQQASTAGAKLPSYIPIKGPKPDLPGTAAGVQDGYINYPKNLIQSVKRTPASGGDVTALVIQYFPPPTPMDQNAYWQELNRELGATFKPIITPDPDYQSKMTAIVAGGDLPDLTLIPAFIGLANQADLVQAQCANLDEYLAGDAVKDYPNLANLPTFAWKSTVFAGSIYGIPHPRGVFGNGMFVQQNLLDQAGVPSPKNADEFLRVMKDVTQPKRNVWGLGASLNSTYGIGFFQQLFGVPNGWRQQGGKFTRDLETEQNKETVAYMQTLFQAGVFHPDANNMSTSQSKTAFVAGKIASYWDGFNAFQQHWETITPINPDFKIRLIMPFAHNGGRGRYFFGGGSFGNTFIKKAGASRVKELLRVVDYFAAPFGSREYLLITSGVKDIDYTLDDKGNPIPTKRGQADTTLSSGYVGTYVVNCPTPIFDPKYPEYARVVHQQEEQLVPLGVMNPTVGLYSNTNVSKGTTLGQMVNDRLSAIIAGRAPMSDYDNLVRDWRSQGGDQIRQEYEEAYKKNPT